MAGFENDVLLCKNINFDTQAPKPHIGIITAGGQLPIGTGNTSPTPEILAGSITSPDFSLDIGYSSPNITAQINPNIRKSGGFYQNLGISYDAGTGVFTVRGADDDLSASNPAYVTFQNQSPIGELITAKITENQSFIDDNGASEIIGNLFGFNTGVAITVDVPFFIYAVLNDNNTDVSFMLCRIPGRTGTNITNNMGKPGTPAVTNSQINWFAFEDINLGEYDNRPALCVGSFRMKMSASDDWTVSALFTNAQTGQLDGIGNYQTAGTYRIPPGQLGATAGGWGQPNGGTAPVFTAAQVPNYKFIGNTPFCLVVYAMSGDGGTDGAGAVAARFIIPFIGLSDNGQFVGTCRIRTPTYSDAGMLQTDAGTYFEIYRSASASTPILWSAFSNGVREIYCTFLYQIHGNV